MIRYFFNKGWNKKVKDQITLEKIIYKHTANPNYSLLHGIVGFLTGMLCMIPAEALIEDADVSLLFIYFFPTMIVMELYVASLLKVNESGKKINIFTKYQNIPVERHVLVTAKTVLLFRKCVIFACIYQGINLLTRLAVYSISGKGFWSMWNIYPIVICVVIYIIEYLQIRFYALKM